jgi:hypothetical protein
VLLPRPTRFFVCSHLQVLYKGFEHLEASRVDANLVVQVCICIELDVLGISIGFRVESRLPLFDVAEGSCVTSVDVCVCVCVCVCV